MGVAGVSDGSRGDKSPADYMQALRAG
jgi:hypothetical protein